MPDRRRLLCILYLSVYALKLMAMERRRRRRRIKQRQRLARRIEGRGVSNKLHLGLRLKYEDSFKNQLRMDDKCFNTLLTIVQCRISRADTCFRDNISANKRLSLTLRFLATGETFDSLSYSTRIARNIIKLIVMEVLTAITEFLGVNYIRTPHREELWLGVANKYMNQWRFPNCLGAVDGKHIEFKPPGGSGSEKETDSIVLFALVSANYQFLAIDIGINGQIRDSGMVSRNLLSNNSSEISFDIPIARCLPLGYMGQPYVVVASNAFPSREWIMQPYTGKELSTDKRIFNYRINRALKPVENAFGIMSNRFRILLQPMNFNVTKVELITKACCILHNFLLIRSKNYYPKANDNMKCSLRSIVQQGGNQTAKYAREARHEFKTYFNTCGKIPGQYNCI